MNSDGSGQEEFVNSLAENPVAMSFDWVHHNLYWTDSSHIEAITVPDKWRHVILDNWHVDHVRALLVDPRTNQRYVCLSIDGLFASEVKLSEVYKSAWSWLQNI